MGDVDAHWRKLTMVSKLAKYHMVDYEPKMILFKQRWERSTIDEQRAML